MHSWQVLSKMTLLGTERHREHLQAEGDLGHIFSRLFTPDNTAWEKAVLDSAALLTFYRLSGAKPTHIAEGLIEPAGVEALPQVSSCAAGHLSFMLSDSRYREVLPEWLVMAAERQLRVPYLLLPDLLDAGRQDRSLRQAIVRVIGSRGRWLATLNDDWQYATVAGPAAASGEMDAVWEEGAFAARILYLQELRRNDPEKALHLISSAWGSEGARERGQLLETLQIELGTRDEPFLEQCLDDRSKEVRKTAAALLACLPESRLCHRMIERTTQLLTLKPRTGLLSKLGGKRHMVEVVLPVAWESLFERDGILQKPPAGKGEKGWWLEQMLSAVPPCHWADQWNVTASEVVESAMGHESQDLLFAAWTMATMRHRDNDWAEALIAAGMSTEASLWEAVPLQKREKLIRALLGDAKNGSGKIEVLQLLAVIPAPWSRELTRDVAAVWQGLLKSDPNDYRLHGVVRTCALRMDPNELDNVTSSFAPGLVEGAGLRKQLEETLNILTFRADMMREFNEGR